MIRKKLSKQGVITSLFKSPCGEHFYFFKILLIFLVEDTIC